jgi:IS5 family transposase
LYDSRAMRQFVGIDLGREPVPDETTICKFRHLLEAHHVGEQLFARIGAYLATHGMKVNRGTIVDATIISAPSSTKNRHQGAGSGDASDQEGEPVVFRDEGAYWRGQPDER